jgi:long-subunit acyl-CoA synthetase (AMP-forming)
VGILSKNRKEWNLTNYANFHQKITTVGFFDTLGPDAVKFIVSQTGLITMFVSHEYIDKLCKIKLDDKEGKMTHLKNIVVFENDTT